MCIRPKHQCVCVVWVYLSLSLSSLLTHHLYIHHLQRNCVHAVCTSNALSCCFWWRLVPSHTLSTKYEFPLAFSSLRLHVLDVESIFAVETLHPVCFSFCSCIPSKYLYIQLHLGYSEWLLVILFMTSLLQISQITTVKYLRSVLTVKMLILTCTGAFREE